MLRGGDLVMDDDRSGGEYGWMYEWMDENDREELWRQTKCCRLLPGVDGGLVLGSGPAPFRRDRLRTGR